MAEIGDWASSGTATKPSDAQIESGYEAADIPLPDEFNWIIQELYDAIPAADSPINQVGHGFTTGDVVYDNNGTWAKADGSVYAQAKNVWVADVTDVDNFFVRKSTRLTITGHGLTVGDTYYLDYTTPGALTNTKPTADRGTTGSATTYTARGWHTPVLVAVTANEVDVLSGEMVHDRLIHQVSYTNVTFNPINAGQTDFELDQHGTEFNFEVYFDGGTDSSTNAFHLTVYDETDTIVTGWESSYVGTLNAAAIDYYWNTNSSNRPTLESGTQSVNFVKLSGTIRVLEDGYVQGELHLVCESTGADERSKYWGKFRSTSTIDHINSLQFTLTNNSNDIDEMQINIYRV